MNFGEWVASISVIIIMVLFIPWLIWQFYDLKRMNKQAKESWRMFQEAHKKIMELKKDE